MVYLNQNHSALLNHLCPGTIWSIRGVMYFILVMSLIWGQAGLAKSPTSCMAKTFARLFSYYEPRHFPETLGIEIEKIVFSSGVEKLELHRVAPRRRRVSPRLI